MESVDCDKSVPFRKEQVIEDKTKKGKTRKSKERNGMMKINGNPLHYLKTEQMMLNARMTSS